MRLLFRSPVKASVEKIKQGFNRDLFLSLNPPWIPSNLKRFDGCSPGDQIQLDLGFGPFKVQWLSAISEEKLTPSEWLFVDIGQVLPAPLTFWKHHHRVVKVNENESIIYDEIEFRCKNLLIEALIYPFLWSSFAIRPKRYKKKFEGKL